MYREALEKSKAIQGKEHPNTLTTAHNLALCLDYQGRYQEAEQMNREVLEKRKAILGEEHSDTLTSKKQLESILSRKEANPESVTTSADNETE